MDSGFFEEVYEIVEQIPKGRVMTYGQIARFLGRPKGARLVGWALRAAPSQRNLPCHRVLAKSGAPAPDLAFGGAGIQRGLLEAEGVKFLDSGCADMSKSLWMDI